MTGKSLNDQIEEIAKLLADSQRKQEQAQFALRTLQERLQTEAADPAHRG